MRTPEVVNNASFIVIFPVTFIANTFVSTTTMPGPLATFAELEPGLGGGPGRPRTVRQPRPDAVMPDVWSLQHPELYTLIWVVIIIGGVRAALDPALPNARPAADPWFAGLDHWV